MLVSLAAVAFVAFLFDVLAAELLDGLFFPFIIAEDAPIAGGSLSTSAAAPLIIKLLERHGGEGTLVATRAVDLRCFILYLLVDV